jgi:integrase
MARRATHLTTTASGTRAQIRIHGTLHRKHFKAGTDPVVIKTWLLQTEIKYRGKGPQSGRFKDDALTYLGAVKAMPTFSDRRQHIEEWMTVFGDRLRREITSDEIRAQLHTWKAAGKAASTVNHRRTALMHLYRVLDGKSAANPVKDIPKFAEPSPFPRAVSSAAIARLIVKLQGADRARAMVIAYTGIPHAQLAKIQLGDFNAKAGTVIVHGRRKGQGTATSIRRLTAKGVTAFKAMAKANAWGPFDRWKFRRAIREACAAAKIDPPLRPYDLRHFFGTELYRRSGDVRAVQILMGHSTPTLTHRYTLGAVDSRVEAALKRWR